MFIKMFSAIFMKNIYLRKVSTIKLQSFSKWKFTICNTNNLICTPQQTLNICTDETRFTRLTDTKVICRILSTPTLLSRRSYGTEKSDILHISTNVQNNVLLYKNPKSRQLLAMHFFSISHLFGWLSIAYYAYSPDLWNILQEKASTDLSMLILFLLSAVIGPGMYSCLCLYVIRCIKYIILHKGGETVSLITFHPFKKERVLTLPVGNVTAQSGRQKKAKYMPVKVKNTRLFFLIDNDGEFYNTKLFDCTIGRE